MPSGVCADDAVAAVVPVGLVEHVHAAALAFGAAGDLAEHLGHAGAHAHAAGERVTVVAVGGDDRVVLLKAVDGADGEGFLPDVEMAEAADLGLLVRLGAAVLKLTDGDHVGQPLDECLVGDRRRGALGAGLAPADAGEALGAQVDLAGGDRVQVLAVGMRSGGRGGGGGL
ncbi:MAG: hypothetical protein QM783_09215 [Phycisphaerales bacterium]